MFERYTETARRVIFFARYEASQFGSRSVETEHLLLGLLREDKALANRFLRSHAAVESIRKQIEGRSAGREKVSISVDLPLSHEVKRSLAHAAEESERSKQDHVETGHLLLGLLREEKSFAAEILHERGLRDATVREELARPGSAKVQIGGAMPTGKVKIGIIGSQFEADIHAAAIQSLAGEAEVVAVASPTPGHAAELAAKYAIPRAYQDYREMLADPAIEMVTIAAPNQLHAQMTADIARAGKHVVCEKPLAMTLEEADGMIDICRKQGVLLMYAEELYFTPKYLKAKEMADQGAFGKVHLVKQSEKHFGPHGDWFWDVERSGGGVVMDMGCHGIAFCWWFLGRPAIQSVYAHMGTYVHGDKTIGEDEAVCILEFAGGAMGLVENSWARRGGMDDRIEVFGDAGLTYANLHMGNALPTYSERGYGYAVEKAPSTTGWSYPVYEELWNYGFPQEMRHFARCARGLEEPQATGEDGRMVLEAICAAYASAGSGARVALPYRPAGLRKPIDGWRGICGK